MLGPGIVISPFLQSLCDSLPLIEMSPSKLTSQKHSKEGIHGARNMAQTVSPEFKPSPTKTTKKEGCHQHSPLCLELAVGSFLAECCSGVRGP
jgi:hypothetical protein